MKEIDNIHRVAWFTAYTTREEVMDTAILNEKGEFLPVARALFNDLDPVKADCYAEPTELTPSETKD